MSLSLPAELLLLSFDPATMRLYRVRRGRLLLALAAADGAGPDGSRWSLRRRGRRALRRALAELRADGLAEPGRTPALAADMTRDLDFAGGGGGADGGLDAGELAGGDSGP